MRIKQRKPYLVKEVGEWKFTFHYKEGSIGKTYLKVTSTSGIMSLVLGGNTHAYGYLLAAAKQGLDNQLAGYAMALYIPAMAMTQDAELTADIMESISRHCDRMDKKGAEEASRVTDDQEAASQALMEDIVSEQGMSERELKAKREADRQMMREVLNEAADLSAAQGQI